MGQPLLGDGVRAASRYNCAKDTPAAASASSKAVIRAGSQLSISSARAAHLPADRWLRAANYDPATLAERRPPNRWELDRDLSLRYGIGRMLRPYDGEREGRTFANLVVLWRF